MKKYLKILLLILTLTLCIACKKEEIKEEKIDPFELKEEYYKESKMDDLDLDSLNKLIEDKESFGVFVYLPGCTSCAAFSEVLTDFQKDNTISFYKTQIKYAKETEIGKKIEYAPSFVVFKEGKVVAYLDAASDEDKPYYDTVENFKEWLTKYIILK
jgi:hypothetical protein